MKKYFRKIWQTLIITFARSWVNSHSNNIKSSSKTALFILPWLTFGGAEKVALQIIEALNKDGWEIVIVTTKGNKHEWKDKFSAYSNNILHIESLPEKFHAYIFIELLKKFNVDVTFISNSFTGYLATPHLSKYSKVIDLVHGEGGKEDQGGTPAFSAPFDQYLIKRIVISERLKNLYMQEYKIDPDKIILIRNGIESIIEFSDISLDKNIDEFIAQGKIITWIGRLSIEKRPELVIELAKKMPGYNFIIIGGGDQVLQTIPNVLQTGELPNEKAKKILSQSDVFILTSVFEGVPIVVLEAMSLGKPVVATNVGAISEVIKDSENGYLVDKDRVIEDMPGLIERAYENKAQFVEKNKNKILNEYNLTTMQSNYVDIFNELIKK